MKATDRKNMSNLLKQAVENFNNGNYNTASAGFYDLAQITEKYKDLKTSSEKTTETKKDNNELYNDALDLITKEEFKEANELLKTLAESNYKDTQILCSLLKAGKLV